MRIHELKILKFRNLRNFEIHFDKVPIAVLLGKNGAAKSNLIEFLAHIFAELELEEEKPQYSYYLRYECRRREIEIDARFSDPEITTIRVDNEPISFRQFVKALTY